MIPILQFLADLSTKATFIASGTIGAYTLLGLLIAALHHGTTQQD